MEDVNFNNHVKEWRNPIAYQQIQGQEKEE